jgi:hypothetical protein
MENIDDKYFVDFDRYCRNMSDDAWARMLEQFHVPWRPGFTWNHVERCWDRAPWGRRPGILRQFLDVFIRQCQELYDVLIDLQRARTVAEAEGENLAVLGRIVGADHGRPLLDSNEWFHTDDPRTVDKAPVWVFGAQTVILQERADADFRYYIIAKSIRNHTRYASTPDVQSMIKALFGLDLSFIKTGPLTVVAIAPGADKNQKYILGTPESNDQHENFWVPPYPAGLSVAGVITE